jgi:hypothetical protein
MTNSEADLHRLAHLERKMQVSLRGDTGNGGCCSYSKGGAWLLGTRLKCQRLERRPGYVHGCCCFFSFVLVFHAMYVNLSTCLMKRGNACP